MDINAYLKRIDYHGSLAPTAGTLRDLQVAHLHAVPFENLSIHFGEPIVLNDQALFAKIVDRRRGGFCYELNGLFAALLRELGFQVQMLSAGVVNSEGVVGPEFDHMTLMITLNERWLADAGFGDSFREPLLLDEPGIQTQGEREFQIITRAERRILMQREIGGDWKPQYDFTLQPRVYSDYERMCHFHQTSPDSHFTRGPLCSLATPEGRITLSGGRFITTIRTGDPREVAVTGDAEFARLLRDHFGIVMK